MSDFHRVCILHVFTRASKALNVYINTDFKVSAICTITHVTCLNLASISSLSTTPPRTHPLPPAHRQIAVLGSNYSAELLEAIDADQLPKMYGGACDCKAGGAGDCCVPAITPEKAREAYVGGESHDDSQLFFLTTHLFFQILY